MPEFDLAAALDDLLLDGEPLQTEALTSAPEELLTPTMDVAPFLEDEASLDLPALLEMDEVKLEFTDDALHAIAKKALERDTGARALRAVIEEFMLDIMYEIPKDENIGRVIITGDYIDGRGGPVIDMRGVPELESAVRPKIAENS